MPNKKDAPVKKVEQIWKRAGFLDAGTFIDWLWVVNERRVYVSTDFWDHDPYDVGTDQWFGRQR